MENKHNPTTKRWTEEETAELLQMIDKYPVEVIASKLDRSKNSIYKKLAKMNIKLRNIDVVAKNWTEEESAELLEMIEKYPVEVIARKLKRSKSSVYKKLNNLNVKLRDSDIVVKRWTEEETAELLQLVNKYPVDFIAVRLNRTSQSIYKRLSHLKINLKDNDDKITIAQFCRETNIKRYDVMKFEKDYGLPIIRLEYQAPAKRSRAKNPEKRPKPTTYKSNYVKICPEQFWKWAYKHQHLINWKKFPRFALGYEPDWVKDLRVNGEFKSLNPTWTKEDIDQLTSDLLKGEYTYPQLGKRYDRSQAAIGRIISERKLPLPVPLKIKRQTLEELQTLYNHYKEGTIKYKIANEIERSEPYVTKYLRLFKSLESVITAIKNGDGLIEIAKTHKRTLQETTFVYEESNEGKSIPEIIFNYAAYKKVQRKTANQISHTEQNHPNAFNLTGASEDSFTINESKVLYV